MEEEAEGSSKRRRPHGLVDWASLPPELVQDIADRVLSTTGGVDAYMDMRAVCPSWRSAIVKPAPFAAFADHRFRPWHWIMVDLKSESRDDEAGLFLHVPTGRFRRLRLPALRGHTVLGASDGLIVLMERERPYLARVLNPLTGDMLHFAASLDPKQHFGEGDNFYTAVSASSHPTLILWREWEWRWETVICANPTSDEFTEKYIGTWLKTMIDFQGNVYYAGRDGLVVFKFVATAERCDHELLVTAQILPDMDLQGYSIDAVPYLYIDVVPYLVESNGQLLLVRLVDQDLKVLRVDVEHKTLEEVRSLGGCHALFLGDERCVYVEADKFPSVQGDCVYISDMSTWLRTSERRGRMYNLRDGTMEIIYTEQMLHFKKRRLRPLSLIQVLLDYCSDITWLCG